MDTTPDEDAATATARAQALVAAARVHPDASFAADLAVSFAAESPHVKAWLYGDAPDQNPPPGNRALAYRSDFAGQPASQLSVVGEAKVMNAVVPSYVLGSVVATTKAHPFAAMGAAVTGLTFDELTTRRRFAIRSAAPAFQRVEVATLTDGGLITHERCIIRCVTASGAVGCLHHEVVTWHHRTVCVPGEVPATETAAARLLQRCSRRREPCGECAPSGEAVPQPCPHVEARVMGVSFSRGWDDYVDLLIDTPVGGTAHFELQQPATAAAAMATPPAEPAETRAAIDPDAMVLSTTSPLPSGSSTTAATAAPGSSLSQAELGAGSAVLPPVSYHCDHFSLESPEQFFNTTRRQAQALAEAYISAAGHAQGPPADTPVAPAVAELTAGRAGSEQRRPPPLAETGAWEPGVASLRPGLAVGFPAVDESVPAAPAIGATMAGSLYRAGGPHNVGGTDDAIAVAGTGRDLGAASAAATAAPTVNWLQREPEGRFDDAQQVGPESSAMEQPLGPTLFPVDTPLFSQGAAPPLFTSTPPQGTATPLQGTEPLMKATVSPTQNTVPPMLGTTLPMLSPASMPSSTYSPWLTTGQRPLDTAMPPPAVGAVSSTAPSQPALHHPFRDPPRDLRSSPPRPRSHMCERCGNSFSSASDLSRHAMTVHDRIRRWKCPHCDFLALQRGHLTTHRASVHATERRFVCEKCEPGPTAFRGVTRSAVQRHTRRVHEGQRPYQCKECDTRFASTSDLTRHRRRLHGAIISSRAETLRAKEEAMERRKAATIAEESGAGSASPAVGGPAAASVASGCLSEPNPSMSAGLSSSTGPTYSSYGAAAASESAASDAFSTRPAAGSTRGVPGSGMEPAIWGPHVEPLLDDGGTRPPPNLPRTPQGVLMPAATAAPSVPAGLTPLRVSADQVSDWQWHLHGALPPGRSYESEQTAQATVVTGMGGTVPRPPAQDSSTQALETDVATHGSPALAATTAVLPTPPPPSAASEGSALPEAEEERHDSERRDTERRLRCLPVRRGSREQDGSLSCCWPHRHPWHR